MTQGADFFQNEELDFFQQSISIKEAVKRSRQSLNGIGKEWGVENKDLSFLEFFKKSIFFGDATISIGNLND